jgi:hypothetical protein
MYPENMLHGKYYEMCVGGGREGGGGLRGSWRKEGAVYLTVQKRGNKLRVV